MFVRLLYCLVTLEYTTSAFSGHVGISYVSENEAVSGLYIGVGFIIALDFVSLYLYSCDVHSLIACCT